MRSSVWEKEKFDPDSSPLKYFTTSSFIIELFSSFSRRKKSSFEGNSSNWLRCMKYELPSQVERRVMDVVGCAAGVIWKTSQQDLSTKDNLWTWLLDSLYFVSYLSCQMRWGQARCDRWDEKTDRGEVTARGNQVDRLNNFIFQQLNLC